LQIKLVAELPYRRATELLRELLPQTAGITPMTTRNRTTRIESAIEAESRQDLDHRQTHPDKADHLRVGIDGAFVKAKRNGQMARRHFDVLAGRIEQERSRGEAFAIVRDLGRLAKPKVQALLPRARRTSEIAITVLSGGENGLRGMVG
jgi:hypothetical protein